jgi:hypothetical protein
MLSTVRLAPYWIPLKEWLSLGMLSKTGSLLDTFDGMALTRHVILRLAPYWIPLKKWLSLGMLSKTGPIGYL